ncbi:MAG: DUF1566 domain-containing protein [Chitinophagaceae bacterium]|nr:DUF1566 domain-containing protein [Chitinophagaceae bacterium]
MKYFITSIYILMFSIISFSQTKQKTILNYNTNPSIEKLIKKILQYQSEVRQEQEFGGARVNSITGYSSFDFPKITQNDIQFKISYQMNNSYGILDNSKVYNEIGSLKNFRFLNKYGAFNTKALVAEWRTKSRSSIGYFEIFIPDQDKNEILIRVSNNALNWSFYQRLNFSDTRFQEIINDLTISGKPIDFIAERKKREIESLRFENFEIYDTIFKKMNFIDASSFVNKIGNGWRIPTKEELNVIYINRYKNKRIVDLFDNYRRSSGEYFYFWSNTRSGNNVFAQDFNEGRQFETSRVYYDLNIILVREY